MARILGYIASSLDGFIATPDDRLDWLTKYDDVDFGEAAYGEDYPPRQAVILKLVEGRGLCTVSPPRGSTGSP